MNKKCLSILGTIVSLAASTFSTGIYAKEIIEVPFDEILDSTIDAEEFEDILVGSEGFFILPESLALVPDASEIFAEYDDIPAIFISEDSLLGATIYQQTLARGGLFKSLCDKLRRICGIRPAPKKPTLRELERRCENLETQRNKAECRVKDLEDALRRRKADHDNSIRLRNEMLDRALRKTQLFSKCLVKVLPTIIRPFDTTTCEIARKEIGKCSGYWHDGIDIKEFLCGPFPACCPRARD
jgi:hypothetical protein